MASGTLPTRVSLNHSTPRRFTWFSDVSNEEAMRVIQSTPEKTPPMDFISTSIIHGACDVIAPPPPYCDVRESDVLAKGKFPTMFKVGQVTPLPKKPGISADDMSNCRSVTNLSTIENILECLAMKQIRRHMESTENTAPKQSAYIALHSTDTATTRVISVH